MSNAAPCNDPVITRINTSILKYLPGSIIFNTPPCHLDIKDDNDDRFIGAWYYTDDGQQEMNPFDLRLNGYKWAARLYGFYTRKMSDANPYKTIAYILH